MDPGIGFAKTKDQNWELLRQVDKMQEQKYPVLLGFSYKRFLGDIFPNIDDRKYGNLAVISQVYRFTDILRVHDVKLTVDFLQVLKNLENK